ncbi:MAG: GntR family transcriptional regulator [Terracidiphilus sp.]
MRLWFSPASEVPIYRQLATQVVLAILSGDLKPGDRLPSTRELARRFSIHPNTVSAGYRELAEQGWVDFRHGSGVYVKNNAELATTPEQILDQHIVAFFRAVRELRLPAATIRKRVAEWTASPPPSRFVLIDPDVDARELLLEELLQLSQWPVTAISFDQAVRPEALHAAIPLCRPSKTETVRALLPAGLELVTLQIRSATKWLGPELPSLKGKLIAVVSHWDDFREFGRTMLEAAGVDAELLVVRNPRRPRWLRGLEQTGAIVCDAKTAANRALPKGPRIFVFPILSDAVRDDLAQFTDTSQFL